ncbi:MAG: guanylate kinase [Rikenellaceae bacterium]|nr:guanylate kinase [Rikenellaceae bacterium]
MTGKVVIFSAPSGSGKSTLIGRLLRAFPELEFSVSATSRAPRGREQDGREYYFLSGSEFRRRVESGEFVEWEEVYAGTCYGTLRSEVDRIWAGGRTIVFDIDVKGALSLKRIFGAAALSVFIMPPSVCELEKRLVARGTDSPEVIARRISKATEEIGYAEKFDRIVINDRLEAAEVEIENLVRGFIGK